jgi:1-acyl-sn-glycerol-3-phosphate acyltransferase
MVFYAVIRWIVAGGAWLLYRVRIRGKEKLPAEGGYVLAPSHRSMMEIPFVAWLTPQRLRYMGKRALFDKPVLGNVFIKLGGFPVERDGTDRRALRESIAMLQSGEILLVFAEGTRMHGPKIEEPLQPGAAYLALRAGVPIVPVGIAGSEEILRTRKSHIPRFGRVTMVVGDPIVCPPHDRGVVPRAEVDALTARLHEAVQQAFDEAQEMRKSS